MTTAIRHTPTPTAPASVPAGHTPPSNATFSATIKAYIGLIKPHVTTMLLLTTLATMVVADNGRLPGLGLALATLLGGLFAAGSANALNCYWDRDIDERMTRTRARSLPAGQVTPRQALVFGLALALGAGLVFAFWVNLLSAALALLAIAFYVVVYTMLLKRTTTQNIVIGGAAGALPAMIGWTAVTGSLSWAAVALFAIVFVWTPPHFWALAITLKNDYARAGVPMLPVVKGEAATRRQIVLYTVALLLTTLTLYAPLHTLGLFYLIVAAALGAALLILGVRLARSQRLADARAFFWFSNYYLALLFAAMTLDRLLAR